MQPHRGRDRSKREKQSVIKTETTGGRKKNREVDWKRKIKKVILRKRNSETEEERREEEEEAEYKPSFCPNYCVTVGLSSNLSPSLHTHPPSCHILYRPIWIKTGMNRRETEWEREREREMWWTRGQYACSLACILSCLIAQGDSMTRWTGAGETADKRAAVVAGCSASVR